MCVCVCDDRFFYNFIVCVTIDSYMLLLVLVRCGLSDHEINFVFSNIFVVGL